VSQGWDSLTTCERAVVALLADGHSNQTIASRLYVSRRTVESHLGRVYAKLGFVSRSQLVAAAARRAQIGL
jgi:DNA-binding CsgD family transcriptional regulator